AAQAARAEAKVFGGLRLAQVAVVYFAHVNLSIKHLASVRCLTSLELTGIARAASTYKGRGLQIGCVRSGRRALKSRQSYQVGPWVGLPVTWRAIFDQADHVNHLNRSLGAGHGCCLPADVAQHGAKLSRRSPPFADIFETQVGGEGWWRKS